MYKDILKRLIKLVSSESFFSNWRGNAHCQRIGPRSQIMIVDEVEGTGYYQDIHGRVRMPGGFNLSLSQEETPMFESFTNEEYEQMNLNLKLVPQKVKPAVCLEDGSIKVSSERLEVGTQYQIFLDDKKYLIVKCEDGVIDIYESTD